MARWKYGDIVKINGVKVKVASVWSNSSGDYIYRLRFDDGSEGEYPENHIKPVINANFSSTKPPTSMHPAQSVRSKSKVMTGSKAKIRINGKEMEFASNVSFGVGFKKYDNDVTCPLCGDEWHVIPSPFRGMKEMWYDCTRCNLSRDNIKKQLETNDDEF